MSRWLSFSILLAGLALALSGRAASVPASEQASTGGDATAVSSFSLPDLPYNAREGRTLFRHYCAPCHGGGGEGDGFNAYSLDPRPRDLTSAELQDTRSDEDLVEAIRLGGAAVGLSTGMPPWGRTLSERQIANLVIYVRALRAGPAAGAEDDALRADDR